MDRLTELENRSVYIIREAYNRFKSLCMLWSIGKDSTVLLYLARRAFFGHVPMPLVHIDTHYKIPEMIEYRDNLTRKWKLDMIYGENAEALKDKHTFPDNAVNRIECCRLLKTEALKHTLGGDWPRYRFNHKKNAYETDKNTEPFTGVIVGVRADEEGSRSKERYFSPRDVNNDWDVAAQPPEFWNQFTTSCEPGEHVRVQALLDLSERDIWLYIQREGIPIPRMYFARGREGGKRFRFRSLGCWPITAPVESEADTIDKIIDELAATKTSERAGRAQDHHERNAMQKLRAKGFM